MNSRNDLGHNDSTINIVVVFMISVYGVNILLGL